jgi:hypothetical protein
MDLLVRANFERKQELISEENLKHETAPGQLAATQNVTSKYNQRYC